MTAAETRIRTDTDPDLLHHHTAHAIEVWVENLLFRFRPLILVVMGIASLVFAYLATGLTADASFQKMVPAGHPYIANTLKYESELRPLGNVVRIAVEAVDGDIYSKDFLETLRKVTDEVFYIPGVDRGNLKSLWTPNVMWYEVTEEGMRNGVIVPQGFDGSERMLAEVRTNVLRSGRVGSLVASDHRSAVVLAPLLEIDPQTGAKLDYGRFSEQLEQKVRDRFQDGTVRIHITGFAKIVGDLIAGAQVILLFFGVTFVLTTALLFWYSRCLRSTLVTVFCCGLAVLWQLGIVRLLGFGLDPYSILVPFLTFAIGVSHAVQNINTMASMRAAGHSTLEAAKVTFRLLFVPGSIALVCDAVGFSTLLVIQIGVIQELAISASIGVAVVIITKMLLLPVLMSYVGVGERAIADQRAKARRQPRRIAFLIAQAAKPRWAAVAVGVALALLVGAHVAGRDLKIGDLDPGAPELRADSRYNRDVAFFAAHYATSPDVFVAMVRTASGECGSYPVAALIDRYQWEMESVPGVESSASMVDAMKKSISGTNGGDLRWSAISRDRYVSNAVYKMIPPELHNSDCSMVPVMLYLTDHKAETLTRVIEASEKFAARANTQDIQILLAAGTAGIEGATNIVIKSAERTMLFLVYGIVAILLLWEFRSWRVVVAIMFPLYITSVLCEAIMAQLGLGVKVATLPVIALGVGIGVDYGIYIYNRLESYLENGLSLPDAYVETLKTTGTAVAMTGVTLAIGVMSWVFSDIKFQADMGLLLTFMFLWNMMGAIVLIPAVMALLQRRSPHPV
ncbi:efflux RND transporter permease subunit [Magnetospirillum molischianum]|uniref:Predicted exporter, RND superfamily protein n=1 Tax=Magnetospirillum molischianum DSM 120 TaxID=1150626 RepID=H8FSB3_MAGML|nr:MMPL family transporter [Magnetospirillum molischianum]CCG41251.1 Predicted exporter, RND superfamily protein [Magnetospirillum molischianum DSM 120]